MNYTQNLYEEGPHASGKVFRLVVTQGPLQDFNDCEVYKEGYKNNEDCDRQGHGIVDYCCTKALSIVIRQRCSLNALFDTCLQLTEEYSLCQ